MFLSFRYALVLFAIMRQCQNISLKYIAVSLLSITTVFKQRQRYLIAHSQEAYDARYKETCRDSDFNRHAHFAQQPIGKTAEHARYGINLLAEYHRLVVEQHVAYHSSGRSRDAPHYYSHPKRLSASQTLLYSGNGEKGQT